MSAQPHQPHQPRIPCPRCGVELRLPDRKLLGKNGKCPKCGHRFVLAEPKPAEPGPSPAPAVEPGMPTASVVAAPSTLATENRAATPVEEQAFDFDALDQDPASARIAKIARRKRKMRWLQRLPLIGTGVIAVVI